MSFDPNKPIPLKLSRLQKRMLWVAFFFQLVISYFIYVSVASNYVASQERASSATQSESQ